MLLGDREGKACKSLLEKVGPPMERDENTVWGEKEGQGRVYYTCDERILEGTQNTRSHKPRSNWWGGVAVTAAGD